MKKRLLPAVILFVLICSNLFAQPQSRIDGFNDGEAARQYALWIMRAINDGRWEDASAAVVRAIGFSNVSSDIAYQGALINTKTGKDRIVTINLLDEAISVRRWSFYSETHAYLLKAEHLIAMRRFNEALECLDQITMLQADTAADFTMLQLTAFRGLAYGAGLVPYAETVEALNRFRSLTLSAMDRFPRDPRPLRIFFEYAQKRNPTPPIDSSRILFFNERGFSPSDLDILDTALRRLPFVLENDPELAWMAAPFMRDTNAARRMLASYRAGSIPSIFNRDFIPSASSIPAALNLELINETDAIRELFEGRRGINSPLLPVISPNGFPVLDKDIIVQLYNLIGSEEGRTAFTQNLLVFSGCIIFDDDNDGFIDSISHYRDGVLRRFEYDRSQNNIFDLTVNFSTDGAPVSADIIGSGQTANFSIQWERYPNVEKVILGSEEFIFRPGDFQFSPLEYIRLGGSFRLEGLLYPVPENINIEFTRRSLVSLSSSLRRPSAEFDGGIEEIFLVQGIPIQAIETVNGRQVSVTTFERGLPILQHIDLDLDGRMETIRRFHRPAGNEFFETFNYRSLIASSESDWTGEGRFLTGETYLRDGSVVYSYDMDGSGVLNYHETGIE